MGDQEDVQNQLGLLDQYRRNLQLYLLQKTQHGGSAYVPPSVSNGIREARKYIAYHKKTLRGWGVNVSDQPDDFDDYGRAPEPQAPSPVLLTLGCEIAPGMSSTKALVQIVQALNTGREVSFELKRHDTEGTIGVKLFIENGQLGWDIL